MNFLETSALLGKIRLLDNRNIDEGTVMLWQEALEDIDIDIAMEALKIHIKTSTEYITPALIRQGVRNYRPPRPPIRKRELSPQMQAAYDRAGDSYYWSVEADKIGAAITDSPQEGSPIDLPVLRSPDE